MPAKVNTVLEVSVPLPTVPRPPLPAPYALPRPNVHLPTTTPMAQFFRISIELDAWNVHLSCYGANDVYSHIAFLMVWPIVGIGFTPLIGLVLAILFKQTTLRELRALGRQRGDRGLIDVVLLRYAVPLTMLILFFAFPPVTSLAFRLFEDCTTFSDELGQSQAFLVSSHKHYALECPSDELSDAQSLAWVAILIYPVGTILLCAWLLYLGRAKLLLEEQGTPYTRSIAFLHAPFVPSYFYFDLLELCKKVLLIGFASLIKPGSILQLMVAVLISLLFLVLHLQSLPYRRHLDNMLATTINLSLCVFFLWCLLLQTGVLATEDDIGELSDTGTAVSIMMLVSIVGVLVVTVLLFLMELAAQTATELAEKRQREKWAGCTIEPPTTKWPGEKSYACFLSHYKMEAASDARLLHNMLAKMLRYPIFLDSANLTDLRQLISNGVGDCDVMLVLGTKGLFSRPWCLLEIMHSARLKVPTIIVDIKNSGFDADQSQHYIEHLEEIMGMDDPSSLELLHEHLGSDLTELKVACMAVLTSFNEIGNRQLMWNPNSSDTELIACLQDIIDEMAAAIGTKLEWKGEAHSSLPHKQRKASANQTCSALHLVCNTGEALTEARVLQTELAMRMDRLVSTSSLTGSQGTAVHRAEAVVVLLSRHLLHEPAALMEIYGAVQQGKPIVPICLTGHGYDFKDAQAHLSDLEARLDPGKLAELRQALGGLASTGPDLKTVSVGELQAVLLATLPRIIAVNWEPESGKHQLDAAVVNVQARLKAQPQVGAPALKKIVLKVAPALRLADIGVI